MLVAGQIRHPGGAGGVAHVQNQELSKDARELAALKRQDEEEDCQASYACVASKGNSKESASVFATIHASASWSS
jgi:hypothetical protein